MRRRGWTAVVVVGLVAAACSGGGGDKPGGGVVSKAACTAIADLDGVAVALDEPHVFTLPPDRLARVLDRRAAALGRLVSSVAKDKELHDDVAAYATDIATVRDPIVAVLTQHNAEAQGIGTGWLSALASSAAVTDEQRAAFGRLAVHWSIRYIDTACNHPEELRHPDQDKGPKVEGGTVVYDAFGEGDHGLRAISSRGGPPRDLLPPAGWDDLDLPSVARDGKTLLAVVRRGGATPATGLAVGTVPGGFHVVHEFDQGDIACPRQAADGTTLLTQTRQIGYPSELVRLTGDTAATVAVPAQTLYCADQTKDGTLLLGAASLDRRDHGAFSRVEPGSTLLDRLFDPPHCLGTPYDLAPDEAEELVSTTCPSTGGLWAVDVSTGKAEELFAGLAGAPVYSPSGKWIAFGYIPVGRPKDVQIRVWVMRRDGHGLRQLTTEPSSSWPAWVSDDLPKQ